MVWKNQRYQLIYEYIESPILPPPLNIFLYFWYLIKTFKKLFKSCVSKTEEKIEVKIDDTNDNKFRSYSFFLMKIAFYFLIFNLLSR